MRLEEITSLAALEALVPEWSALFERVPTAAPFLSPQWLLPWWRHLGGGELWVLTAREDGGLVAVLPLFVYLREGHRVLALLGSGISDELDLVAGPDRAPAAAAAVLEHLTANAGRWHAIELRHLPEGSSLLGERRPLSLRLEPGEDCQVLELPSSVEAFRSALRPHHSRNLRRARTLLSARGELSTQTLPPAQTQQGLDALFALHAARWERRGAAGVLSAPALQAFHREACAGLARAGWLRLRTLRVGERTAAVLYGFARGARAFAYIAGFDPELAQASPGTVLTATAIEESIREGARSYDFLRGDERHKATWGARPRQRCRLVLG